MSEQKSRASRVKELTARRLDWLLNQASDSVCKATLADLRRGVGHKPGEMPEVWGLLLQNLPEDMWGRDTEISREEGAIYTALTLFAVHQQGWDPKREPMHRPGSPFGAAVAKLAPGDEDGRERIERRFSQAVTSTEMAEFAQHLRGLVQLLSVQGIPLDWAELAGQLYTFQFPEYAAGIRLRWGEAFYMALNREDHHKEENDDEQ